VTVSETLARIIWLQKGVLSLVGIVLAWILALRGAVSGDAALTFMKWVLSCWLIAQGAEDVAAHFSGTRKMMLKKPEDQKPGA
jgi:hypothetical protein